MLDIGINDPLVNHTINIANGMIEIVPWDIIIDMTGTVILMFVIIYILVLIKNFREGVNGK